MRALLIRTFGEPGIVLVSWEVQHPGNTGALIRSAAAFAATGLIAAGGADPWNPKADIIWETRCLGILRRPPKNFKISPAVA